MTDKPIAGNVDDVLSLCRALRDAPGLLGLSSADEVTLFEQVALAEQAAMAKPAALLEMATHVRAIRYLLVEIADGPISAFMADDAARIVGDGVGRLFS
ncbi:hypothetical protein BJY16_001828 [Actinoplanes octamycinicus]|uniref:Uncharacterized protein n=1 Tax=Actinoplanes octamycinicus TaxID=135948 RepID=A0A7W7GU80_9ACTN|nr:hypothetical protein [Actinoplanes octamycinicus]MBB4738369.1 hypothetical protein [Actinoplanes octamycinicus]